MTRNEVLGKILYRGFLPVVIHDRLSPMACLEQVVRAGIEAVEISCRNPEALSIIREAKKAFPSLAIGGASLMEDGPFREFIAASGHPLPTIDQVADSGVDFLVSILPFREATYRRYKATHVLLPAVGTLGEAQQAMDWGANLLKYINPGLAGGPAFFKGMDAGTYKALPFYTSGGMTPAIIPDYVQVQVLLFSAGFDVILGEAYGPSQECFDGGMMYQRLSGYVESIRQARGRYQGRVPFDGKDPAAISAASGRCLNV